MILKLVFLSLMQLNDFRVGSILSAFYYINKKRFLFGDKMKILL